MALEGFFSGMIQLAARSIQGGPVVSPGAEDGSELAAGTP